MNSRGVAVGLVAVLLFSAVGGLFVGSVGADGTASISAVDPEAGNETVHSVEIPVDSSTSDETGSLNEIVVNYNVSAEEGVDLTGFNKSTVQKVGIDNDSDGTIEKSVADDMESPIVSDNGTKVSIGFGGSHSLADGKTVIVEYNATNPDREGDYGITADLNTDSVKSPETGTFEIVDTLPPTVNISLSNPADSELEAVVTADEELSELNVSISGPETDGLSYSDFNERGGGSDWTYRTTLSNNPDGDYTATIDEAVDYAGNGANPDKSDSVSVNTKTISVDGGNVTPSDADAGATVQQTVNVSVSQASLDGDAETVRFTVNDSVTVENATASIIDGSGSETVSSTTVENNTTVTAMVASGDGGGTTAYTVSYDINATYTGEGPREERFDAKAIDSDGDEDGPKAVASVHVNDVTPPTITNFTLFEGPGGAQDVDLELNASEEFSMAEIELTGDAGGQLSLSDATNQSNSDGTWTYTFDVSEGIDGEFAARIGSGSDTYHAEDFAGNANQDSHNDSLRVNENHITVVDANVTNATPTPGETLDQTVAVDVQDVSLDGETDTIQIVMPGEATDVRLNGVGANATNSSTSTASDGSTVFNASVTPGDDGGVTDVQVTFDVNATYPESTEGSTLPINASAYDSDGDSDTETNLTQVEVQDTYPVITNFTLEKGSNGPQDVDLSFNASERLGAVEVSFENDLAGQTLSLANLTEHDNGDGTYTYTGDVHEGDDGQFNASLFAEDEYDNAAQEEDFTAILRVNETDPVVVDATVNPNVVDPQETVTQNLTASVDGFSRDGSTDEVLVELAEGVDVESVSGLTVTDRNGDEASSADATRVDNRTVRLDVSSGDGLGTANVTADFDATVTYRDSLEGDTVPLNVTAVDSDGAQNATQNETQVQVRNTYPTISNFTLFEASDGVDLTFNASEELAEVTVDLTGDQSATLDRGNLTEIHSDGNWTYTATNIVTTDGTYNATLAAGNALDNAGNANQNDSADGVVVDDHRIDLIAANVTDEPVDPQTTLTQQVVVDVQNVSLDGETDTVDVGIPDSVDVAAESVTSDTGTATLTGAGNLTANLETGSGGGVADVTLTFDVNATYGDSLEGETLSLNASADDSDGDSDTETNLTTVHVRDTHPQITNFTLTNQTRDVVLTFDSTEELGEISVETTGDAETTLTRGNFTETRTDGNWTYVANVSGGIDGTFNATLDAGAALDNADNANNESHADGRTVNTRAVNLTAASVTPDTVDPDTTVEQTVTVSAENFGQDGGTDTLTLTMNDSLNVTGVNSETVESGEASVTGVERVDTDDDGEAERVRISLDTGDTGGTTDVTTSLNATVQYPESVEGATLPVNASADDSDGDSDAEQNLTSVRVRGVPPTITNFSLTVDGQDVDLGFNASEQLGAVQVDLGGNLDGTLNESDFAGEQVDEDDWAYTANISDGQDGYVTASLATAEDRFGNDGADDESDSLRVNEVGPQIRQTRISPDALLPGERTNQTITTNVTGLSQDGVNDTVTYEFVNESVVELGNVTADGANASAVVADNTSVVVTVSTGNASGSANVTLTTTLTATYENATEGQSYNVTTLVTDSLNETAVPVNTTVAVNDTMPEITAFNLSADGQDVNLTVETNESLAALNVSVGGDMNETLTRENFTEFANGTYRYEANVSDGSDGNFSAELTNATDPYGNNATVGPNDSLVVDTENVTVDALNVTPSEVRPNETVDQTTVLNLTELNRDGVNDTATVTFDNGTDVLTANATAENATVAENVSDQNSDTLNETVGLDLNTTDVLGTTNVSVVLNTTTHYNDSLEGTNVTVESVVNDSDGSNDTATTNVTVVDTTPNVTGFDVWRNGTAVELSIRSDEELETARVALSGRTGGNLTRADFTATREGEWIIYNATLAEDRQGTFGAELAEALDNAGNDGAVAQNDSLVYRAGGGGDGAAGSGGGQRVRDTVENTTEPVENVTRIDNSTAGLPVSVRTEQTSDEHRIVVENARPDISVAAHLTPTDVEADAGVSLSDVGLTATANDTTTLTVQHDRAAEAFESLPNGVDSVLQYETNEGHVTDTTYTLRVDDDRLGERSPDAVRVFDGDGSELNATYTGATADKHSFRLDTDADQFTVALTGANVSVVDADLPAANETGAVENASLDDTAVNVTLRNTGPVAGNWTVNVTAANEQVLQRTVRMDANTTRTVQLSANVSDLDREGPILIEANGVEAGVIPSDDERSTATADPDMTTTSADSPFALATLLVALAGAALLARRE